MAIPYLTSSQAEKKINDWAARNEDFLFIINYTTDKCIVCTPSEARQRGILYQLKTHSNFDQTFLPDRSGANNNFDGQLNSIPPTYSDYLEAFQKVQSEIQKGNTYLINLCFESKILDSLSLQHLFMNAAAPYRLLFRDQFLVFSPEPFIKIKDGKIHAYPMKGTIKANRPDAANTLLEDEKELAEHYTIVDLLRNDLSIWASDVEVPRFRFIDKVSSGKQSLYQTSSEIVGNLPGDYANSLGTILFSMLPAGSITGAPKKSTAQILSEVENFDRGFYTGVVGTYSSGVLESAVMIRFIEKRNGDYFYKSGGGITFNSRPENEYRELIDKIYVPFT
nr:aminodeoxychorismate synthase component I [Saprospiraceae bacterium]